MSSYLKNKHHPYKLYYLLPTLFQFFPLEQNSGQEFSHTQPSFPSFTCSWSPSSQVFSPLLRVLMSKKSRTSSSPKLMSTSRTSSKWVLAVFAMVGFTLFLEALTWLLMTLSHVPPTPLAAPSRYFLEPSLLSFKILEHARLSPWGSYCLKLYILSRWSSPSPRLHRPLLYLLSHQGYFP